MGVLRTSILLISVVLEVGGLLAAMVAGRGFFQSDEVRVGVFGPPTSKFVFARLARMVCSEDTRVYTSSGRMSLRPVCCFSCYRHLVCSRGYKQAREGKDPKSLVKGMNGY